MSLLHSLCDPQNTAEITTCDSEVMKDSVASPSPPLGALALGGAGHPVVRTLGQFRGRELRALPQAAPHCQPCDGASLDASPRPRSQADGLPLAAAALACSGVTQGHPSPSGDPPLPGTRHSRSPQRPSRLTDLHSDSPPSAQSGHTAPTLRHLRPACPLSRARLGVQTGQLSTGVRLLAPRWPRSSRLAARRAAVRAPRRGPREAATASGPVTHLLSRLSFHAWGGCIPRHQLTSGPCFHLFLAVGSGPGRDPFLSQTGNIWTRSGSRLHGQKTGFPEERGWLGSCDRLQVTGWNEGLLTPTRGWS